MREGKKIRKSLSGTRPRTHRHEIPHIRTAPPAKHRRDRETRLRALCRLRYEEPLLPDRDANTLRSLRPESVGLYPAQTMNEWIRASDKSVGGV